MTVTLSPSSSEVIPAVQVRVSFVPGLVGEILAELTDGGVFPIVTVGLLTGAPVREPSLGVAVHLTVSFRV